MRVGIITFLVGICILSACSTPPLVVRYPNEKIHYEDWPVMLFESHRIEIPVARVFDYSLEKPHFAVCLSGGGYRATLFHAGVLWRLNEQQMLEKLGRIVGVSGGSITAAILGLNWHELSFVDGRATNFSEKIVDPLFKLTKHTIDVPSIIKGALTPSTAGQALAGYYDSYLFKEKKLGDLPSFGSGPQVILLATDMRTGDKWHFSKHAMGNSGFGYIPYPVLKISNAVAASSAYPPALAPVSLIVSIEDVVVKHGWSPSPPTGEDRLALRKWLNPERDEDLGKLKQLLDKVHPKQREAIVKLFNHLGEEETEKKMSVVRTLADNVLLADGGIMSNSGFELCYQSEKFIVSSATVHDQALQGPSSGWIATLARTIDLIHSRAESSAEREYADTLNDGTACTNFEPPRRARCGIRIQLSGHEHQKGFGSKRGYSEGLEKVSIPTRLQGLSQSTQKHIVNWGYRAADQAIVDARLGTANLDLPYPEVEKDLPERCVLIPLEIELVQTFDCD